MKLWTIIHNDLLLTLKDRMFAFWFLIFPLLFAVIFGFAFPERGEEEVKATIGILDQDRSPLSRTLIRELGTEKYSVNLLEDASQKDIRTLIIPREFQTMVLAGEKVELLLEKEEGADLQASQAAYAHLLKGVIKILTRIVRRLPEAEEGLGADFEAGDLERLITLRSEKFGDRRHIPGGFNHAIPGVTVMFILFTLLMYGGIILLQERREGTLERISLTPVGFAALIGGKWSSRILLGLAQIIVLFGAGRLIFGIRLGKAFFAMFLVSVSFCAAIAALSILLGCIIQKEEIIVLVNILAANAMAALGGCWFPLELIPRGVRTVGKIFPTGWAMEAYQRLMFFGRDLSSVLPHIGALLLFSLLFLILAVRFFRFRRA